MGPGTPAMRGSGQGTARVIQDGRWIAGDYEQDQFLADGTFVLKWQLHWVSGWAPSTASTERRWSTTTVMPMSTADTSTVIAWCSSPWPRPGPACASPGTASDGTVIKWRNEVTTGDGSWFLIEEYPMVPG